MIISRLNLKYHLMSHKVKVLIVDDEAPARQVVRNYLAGLDEMEIVGECSNGFEALKEIQEQGPDLVFLDIQMPKIDGFELLEVLERKPAIIFATAYDQYAIRAFEQNAVDYLLKPFSKDRMLQALDKAIRQLNADPGGQEQPLAKLEQHLEREPNTLERVVTRLGAKITVIPVDKIWYIEAQDDYVMIWSELGNHLKEKTMKFFETSLPSQFIRIHRSFIVNITQVRTIEPYSKDSWVVITRSGARLKASAEGYKKLRNSF